MNQILKFTNRLIVILLCVSLLLLGAVISFLSLNYGAIKFFMPLIAGSIYIWLLALMEFLSGVWLGLFYIPRRWIKLKSMVVFGPEREQITYITLKAYTGVLLSGLALGVGYYGLAALIRFQIIR